MLNKEKYRAHCAVEKSIPIFSQAWWLDSVCGDDWDVCLVEKGGEIVASMPYHIKRRHGLVLIIQPPLTQNLGPWMKEYDASSNKILAREKNLMESLIEQLPSYHHFRQNWHYKNKNWLPFFWKGFSQTTRYTYVIEDLSDFDNVLSSFDHSKRKNIKKSEKIVKIAFDIPADVFYENHKYTLAKQGSKISYSFDIFQKIYDRGYKNNSARTIAAYDEDGNLHGALFVIWDSMSAYDLISTIDPDFRNFGAASLLIQEIIKYVSPFVNKFDFEGSMIESVERSFRQFGATQTSYHSISRTPSKAIKIIRALNEIVSN